MIVLTDEQEKIKIAAVKWFRYESEQLFQISGLAGTGKSVLMANIFNELGLTSNQVLCMAYTGQAAIVMRTKGMRSARSIHSSLYEVIEVDNESDKLAAVFGAKGKKKVFRKIPYLSPEIKLIFIDEAYMVPRSMYNDIMSFGIKVIVAGDSHQLKPVGDEPAFLTAGKVHYLTKPMRQNANDPIYYIADRILKNKPIHSGRYGNNLLVIDDTELIPQMFGYADCVVCGTNKTKERLNGYVRELAGFYGVLPHYGERLICRKNNWDMIINSIALANGLIGTVVNNPDPSSFGQDTFNINFKPDLLNDVFYNVPVSYKYFTADTEMKNALKGNSIESKYLTGELFDYAYALTTHLSQGGEFAKGIYIEEFMRYDIQQSLNYTGVTRFKKGLIYVKKSRKYY